SIMVFALTFPGQARLQASVLAMAIDIALNWAWVAALLLIAGLATGYSREFDHDGLLVWLWAAPLSEFASYLLLRAAAPLLLELQGPKERAIIVGMNEQGVALAKKLDGSAYSRISFVGFVDSRDTQRLETPIPRKMLGKLNELASVVQKNHIQVIYLSLPMASQPRILQILDDLKDTTASIYFVPDMFVTD
ncbi:MAG: undecaprenyl-phosphate glucose phosphotransferase, partial [Burkholderiales bacterium PBB4]